MHPLWRRNYDMIIGCYQRGLQVDHEPGREALELRLLVFEAVSFD
jgi:hypothetical protein